MPKADPVPLPERCGDSGFVTPFLHHGAAPRRDGGTVLLVSEGPIARALAGGDGYSEHTEHFTSMLEELGYWCETENHYTVCLFPTDDRLQEDFLSLHRWQWLQHLAERKMFELHSEVFEHFAMHPGDQNRAIPEIVTLVQAKRYKNPIKLEAVAALLGIAAEQQAPNAIFATTSYFQPKALQFFLER